MANSKWMSATPLAANVLAGADGDDVLLFITHDSIGVGAGSDPFWDNVKADGGDIRLYTTHTGSAPAVASNPIAVSVVYIDTVAKKILLAYRAPAIAEAAPLPVFMWWGDVGLAQPAVYAVLGREEVYQDYYFASHDLITDMAGNFPGAFTNTGTITRVDDHMGIPNFAVDFDGASYIDIPFTLAVNEPLGTLNTGDPVTVVATIATDNVNTSNRAVFLRGSVPRSAVAIQLLANPGAAFGIASSSTGASTALVSAAGIKSDGVFEQVVGIIDSLATGTGALTQLLASEALTQGVGSGTYSAGSVKSFRIGARGDAAAHSFGPLTGVFTRFDNKHPDHFRTQSRNQIGQATFFTMSAITEEGGGGDVTAPILSSPTGAQTGSTTGTGTISTDEDNDTLHAVVTLSATAPSVAQIQAGQDNTGASAAFAVSQAVSATGVQTVLATGLTANTAYFFHFQQEDAAGNDSLVSSSATFTTAAAASPQITITMVNDLLTSDPAASLTGLKWAFYDQATPDLFAAAPVDKGAIESTDAAGEIIIDLPNTTLISGEIGYLIITDSDGTLTQDPPQKNYSGPAVID